MKVPSIYCLMFLVCGLCYGQQIELPNITPQPPRTSMPNYQNFGTRTTTHQSQVLRNSNRGLAVYEQDRKRVETEERRKEQANKLVQEAVTDIEYENRFNLPSLDHIEATKYYKNAFNKLSKMNADNFSLKQAVFISENAFYEEQQNYDEFNDLIKRTGSFIREKMNELNYDPNSNLAKNLILFQFFSDTLEIKSKGLKHLPLKYDFEDFWGRKDWSKMFVTKLLKTGKGQCHSLPLLYLMLANEIDAKAYLSLSPNHSYIKFQDDSNKWYNVELTNQMFTTSSFILQNGYITSEALQNDLYMKEQTKKQMMSDIYIDLVMGYTRKFGYDDFVKDVVNKSLELNPNNIRAYQTAHSYLLLSLKYMTGKLGIDLSDKEQFKQINFYPKAVRLAKEIIALENKIDDMGYKEMPAQMYEDWLSSLKEQKHKQNNEELKKRFKLKIKRQLKN